MATELTLRDVLDRIDRFEQDNAAQHKELAEAIAGMRGEWGLFKWVVGIFVAPMSVAIAGVVAYGLFQVFTG